MEFDQSGKTILTSSLDGTVRAFDTTRFVWSGSVGFGVGVWGLEWV